MANNFVHNVDKWLMLSESETDFAVLFVRTWIPFNAWYCNSYPQHKNSDRPCIDDIKTVTNPFKDRLTALLEGEYSEAKTFKLHLGHLHSLLQQHPIPNSDPKKRVSFNNVWFRENIIHPENIARRGVEYSIERRSDKTVITSAYRTRGRLRLHAYLHTKYELNHYLQDINSNNNQLNHEQRLFAISLFQLFDPKKPESVISSKRHQSIEVNGVYFINDSDLLSQAIIEILYSLRCKLFHGELQPTKDNLSVYEPCYQMLRILLKSLK